MNAQMRPTLVRNRAVSASNLVPSNKTRTPTGKPTVRKAGGGTDAKATKKRTWTKPKGKPKRPLSAYNIFFQYERNRIISAPPSSQAIHVTKVDMRMLMDQALNTGTRKRRQHRKSHGKIGFADLARNIAEKWKSLAPELKVVFEERAKVEKDRYNREVDLWMKDQEAKKVAGADATVERVQTQQQQHPQQPPEAVNVTEGAPPPSAPPVPDHSRLTSDPAGFVRNRQQQQRQRRWSRKGANPAVVARMTLEQCLSMTRQTLEMANAVLESDIGPPPNAKNNIPQISPARHDVPPAPLGDAVDLCSILGSALATTQVPPIPPTPSSHQVIEPLPANFSADQFESVAYRDVSVHTEWFPGNITEMSKSHDNQHEFVLTDHNVMTPMHPPTRSSAPFQPVTTSTKEKFFSHDLRGDIPHGASSTLDELPVVLDDDDVDFLDEVDPSAPCA